MWPVAQWSVAGMKGMERTEVRQRHGPSEELALSSSTEEHLKGRGPRNWKNKRAKWGGVGRTVPEHQRTTLKWKRLQGR